MCFWGQGKLTQARLMSWLAGLPKPIGVFAANDQLGVRLLDACQRAGIAGHWPELTTDNFRRRERDQTELW